MMTSVQSANPHTAFVVITIFSIVACGTFATSRPDFIIVGAGNAGCVLAARLCERLPNAQIVILERAPPRNKTEELLSKSARLVNDAWDTPSMTVQLRTEPISGLNGRSLLTPTGRSLGGSSAINAGQVSLPPNGTYDEWGFNGLSDRRAIHLFQTRVSPTIGMVVAPKSITPDFTGYWLRAARRAGFARSNPAARTPESAVWPTLGSFNEVGQRVDSFKGYVAPLQNSKCKHNLQVIESALVEKVLMRKKCGSYSKNRLCGHGSFRKNMPCAYGIKYKRNGKTRFLFAKREVIISGGPYESVKLLQLSGIGPKTLLNRQRIPVVKELPVGLQCQGRALAIVTSQYDVGLARTNNESIVASERALRVFENGKGGPLAFPVAGAMGRSYGNGEILFNSGHGLGSQLINEKVITSACFGNPTAQSFSQVYIRNRDAEAPVHVDLDLLSIKEDARRMVRCTQQIRNVHKQLERPLGTREVLSPGYTSESLDNPQVLEQWIRENAETAHFVGCNAVRKVINPWFSVKGVNGLRVVDSSSIPRIPAGAGPMTSVYIVAEHAADIITGKFRCLS